jgi:hypothetical protein
MKDGKLALAAVASMLGQLQDAEPVREVFVFRKIPDITLPMIEKEQRFQHFPNRGRKPSGRR